jgi:hypothetical protein
LEKGDAELVKIIVTAYLNQDNDFFLEKTIGVCVDPGILFGP